MTDVPRPDPRAIVAQLLLAHARMHGYHIARRLWTLKGGFALLRAAGLPASQARAVNTMAYRRARAWRRDRVDVTQAMIDDEAARLLV